MIKRNLEKHLKNQAKKYPVVSLTGPRQSGKTTLAQKAFGRYQYVSLEALDNRRFAEEDPRGFLDKYRDGVIIDEVQRCPELFSYIQGIVDKTNKPGQFILTGSQNFLLLESITQSLAGRVSVERLLPFSWNELSAAGINDSLEDMLLKGFYPRVYDKKLKPYQWYENYIETYIQRDVRSIKNIGDLTVFNRFVRLCAGRNGQTLNLSNIAADCGVSYNTVKSWISVLEASYIVFLLPPFYKNYRKRLIKTPKLYFYDTGLVAYLLGIRDKNTLELHPLKGALFESFIMVELAKHFWHQGEAADMYFWRDQTGREVDAIIPRLGSIEIKAARTFNGSFLDHVKYFRDLSRASRDVKHESYIVFDGPDEQKRTGNFNVYPWREFLKGLP